MRTDDARTGAAVETGAAGGGVVRTSRAPRIWTTARPTLQRYFLRSQYQRSPTLFISRIEIIHEVEGLFALGGQHPWRLTALGALGRTASW